MQKRGRNLAEANEASLTVANWCLNLWLRLSWCFSLPAGRLMGIRAEQTLGPLTFKFTFSAFFPHSVEKRTVFILGYFDRRQSNLFNFTESMSERGIRGAEVRKSQSKRKRSGLSGGGGEGSLLGEDERGWTLHHNDSEPFCFQPRQTLNRMQVKSPTSNWFLVSSAGWRANQDSSAHWSMAWETNKWAAKP